MNSVPSLGTIAALAKYADLLAALGPDSAEARAFLIENRHLDQFEARASDLLRLEQEDYEERVASKNAP